MLHSNRKITIEWQNDKETTCSGMTNPLTSSQNLVDMVDKILREEIPHLKNNSLLYGLILYSVVEKITAVQTFGNVLSYIKKNHAKTINDVSIINGEVRIKCSV